MPLFSRNRKGRDISNNSLTLPSPVTEDEPQFIAPEPEPSREEKEEDGDPWVRTEVEAEEVQELLHVCTAEMKSRGTLWIRSRKLKRTRTDTLVQHWTCPSFCYLSGLFSRISTLLECSFESSSSFLLTPAYDITEGIYTMISNSWSQWSTYCHT